MSEHANELLGGYLLGALDPEEADSVDQHLLHCEICRREVTELRELEDALNRMPPEVFIDGPPADGELLLRRTLGSVRNQRLRPLWTRRARWTAAAVVAILGLSTVVGYESEAFGPTWLHRPTSSSATTPQPSAAELPPGSRVVSATSTTIDAAMTATIVPVEAHGQGQTAASRSVQIWATIKGLGPEPVGLVVVAWDGTAFQVAILGGPSAAVAGETKIDGLAPMAPSDVKSVQLVDRKGNVLLTASV